MSAARKLARHRAADALKGVIPEVGDRVFRNRSNALWPEEIPAIVVWLQDETATEYTSGPVVVQVLAELTVEIIGGNVDDEDLDDRLDDWSDTVIDALTADVTLGGSIEEMRYTGSQSRVYDDGELKLCGIALRFAVTYYREQVEGSVIDSLQEVNAQWVYPSPEAADVVTLEGG